jgi:hypothetical protein
VIDNPCHKAASLEAFVKHLQTAIRPRLSQNNQLSQTAIFRLSAMATSNWTPDSWRNKPIAQDVIYDDAEHLDK